MYSLPDREYMPLLTDRLEMALDRRNWYMVP
jgi:hypothetical protein